jgi:hypothetical protein
MSNASVSLNSRDELKISTRWFDLENAHITIASQGVDVHLFFNNETRQRLRAILDAADAMEARNLDRVAA